jgi:hypothetical protein
MRLVQNPNFDVLHVARRVIFQTTGKHPRDDHLPASS